MLIPTFAQEYSDNRPTFNVVINEVDINPPGDDSAEISEWIELYNPTDYTIDISGWEIASTTVLKKTLTLSNNTTIQPKEFLTFSYQRVWCTDSNELIELRDENGIIIDKTPLLSDLYNDFKSWQRISDGLDNDSTADWKFVTSTAGSSNGKQQNQHCGAGTIYDSQANVCILEPQLTLKQKQLNDINHQITIFENKINGIQNHIDYQQIRLDEVTLNNATQRIEKFEGNISSLNALLNIYESILELVKNQVILYR